MTNYATFQTVIQFRINLDTPDKQPEIIRKFTVPIKETADANKKVTRTLQSSVSDDVVI